MAKRRPGEIVYDLILAWCAAVVVVTAFLALLHFMNRARADDAYPNCAGWIAHTCCCTRDCCRSVVPGEVEAVDVKTYRVVASGQIVPRTGWSEDGRFVICSCDYALRADGTYGYVRGPGTKVHCLFPPLPSA